MAESNPAIAAMMAKNAKFTETYTAPPTMTQIVESFKSSGQTGTAILTCIDGRCVPEYFFGPELGVPVFRNAGGRPTEDVVRSLTMLRALANLKTVLVIHHSDCGVTHLTPERILHELKESVPDAVADIQQTDYRLFAAADFEKVIAEDVVALRNAKVLDGVTVRGFALETETGKVREVEI